MHHGYIKPEAIIILKPSKRSLCVLCGAIMATIARENFDYDSSSCSSLTVPDSGQSWLSSLSFRSHESSSSVHKYSPLSNKPHKANQATWEAMRLLRCEKGQVGLEHFKLIRRLGGGDIGNVYLCQMTRPVLHDQCLYSMKVVDREALAIRKKLHRAEMEKKILGMLDHPFLPTPYAQFDASHFSCVVMEFCPGADLHAARQRQPTKRFSISTAKFYAAETLLAIEYLHMLGVVYRDLKPENVLKRGYGHIMLSDFDLSLKCDTVPKLIRSKIESDAAIDINPKCSTPCAMPVKPVLSCFSASMKEGLKKEEKKTAGTYNTMTPEQNDVAKYNTELVAEPINARSKSFVGTHEYLAPEIITGQGHGSAVDWWTFGIFLYELLYGTTPFKGENNEKTLINILKQPLTFPRMGVSSSKEYEQLMKVQDLISRLLVKNPKKRIGNQKGSVEIKGHEFFKGVNWALIRTVKPPEVPDNHRKSRFKEKDSKSTKKKRNTAYEIPDNFDYF